MKKLLFTFCLFVIMMTGMTLSAQVLSEDFEGGTLPTGWTQEYVSGSHSWEFSNSICSSVSAHAGQYSAAFKHSSSGDQTKLISPQMDLTSVLNPQLSFWHVQKDWGGDQDELRVYYRTSPTATWTLLVEYIDNIPSWVYEEMLLPSPSATYQIAFEGLDDYGYNIGVDDIIVMAAPTCLKPTDVTVSNITTTTAEISWTSHSSETAWTISYNGTEIPVTTNPYTLTGLTSATSYTVMVRANCSATDSSLWSTPLSFATVCEANTTFPYVEDFESTSFPPICWSQSRTAVGTGLYGTDYPDGAWAHYTSSMGSNSTGKAQLRDTRAGSIHPLVTTGMDLTSPNGYLMSIDVYRNTSSNPTEGIRIYASSTPAVDANAVEIAFISRDYTVASTVNPDIVGAEATTAWYTYELPVPMTGLTYIIFQGESQYGSATYMDNFQIFEAPTCWKPTGVTASNITANTAVISWQANTGETEWELDVNGDRQVVNSNPFTLTGLNANFQYQVGVRAVCSSTDSSFWSVPASFTTLCDALTITSTTPYEDNFDAYAGVSYSSSNGVIPDCWTTLFTGTSTSYYPHVCTSNSYVPTSGSQAMFMCAYNSTTYGPRTYAVLPAFTNELNTLQISFAYSHYASSSYSKLYVGYMTDATDSNTFVALAEVPHAYYYTNRYNFFEYNITETNIPTGARLALRTVNNNQYSDYTFIDDLRVRIQPTCIRPTNVAVVRIDSTEADFSWTPSGNETEWEIQYDTTGFTLGTGTTIVSNAIPATITGLVYGSSYDVYVRAMCSATDSSDWTLVTHFTVSACTPAPSSVDNNGITNVTFGQMQIVNNTTHPHTSPYYGDYTAQVGDGAAATELTVDITFATNFTYGTVIWVNWNNDLAFTDDEVVYTGESQSDNPTTLSCTFEIPANIPVGTYRMRIGAADSGLDGQIAAGSGYTPCYSGYYGVFEDYTLEVTPTPTCIAPNQITFDTVAADFAIVDWNARGEETTWEIEYNGVREVVYEHPYTITNLNPATDYTFRVRALCSATDSSYWTSSSFTTECATIYITSTNSYTQDFEGTVFPPRCWNTVHTAGSSSYVWQMSSYESHSGTQSAYLPDQSVGNRTDLITCEFNIPTPNAYQIRWWQYRSEYYSVKPNEGVKIWVNTTPDTVGGTVLEYVHREYTLSPAENAEGWYEYEAVIPTSGNVYFIFQGISEYGSGSYIDDVTVEIAPTCLKVRNIAASQITSSSAVISWLAQDPTQNLWEIALDSNTTVIANSNPFTLTGLMENTDYVINVRAICSATDTSFWANTPCSFTTDCNPMTLTDSIFYYDDFESYTASTSISDANAEIPDCWDFNYRGSTAGYAPHVYQSSSYTGNSKALIMTTGNSATYGYNVYSALPEFTNAANDLELDFDVCMSSSTYHNLSLGYMTDYTDDSSFVALETFPISYYTNGFQHYEIFISDYNATIPAGARLAFRWSGTSSSSYYVFIDNVRVRIAPTCRRPQNVTVSNIGMNDVTITWTPGLDETQWEVTVGNAVDTLVNDTTVTITGLMATTHYAVLVRSICSATDMSDWTDSVDFMTLCDGITITREEPYLEDFSSYTATTSISTFGEQPDCWDFIYSGTSAGYAPHVYQGTYSPNADNALVMTSGSSSYGTNTFAILPLYTNELNTLDISFKVKMESASYGTLYLGYMTDITDATTFVQLEQVPSATTGTDYEYSLATQTFPANARLAFKWSYTSSYYSVGIDDVMVFLGCEAPTDVEVDENNTVTWDGGDAAGWNLMYIVNGDSTTVHAPNTIYTLTNLPDNADVTVMVQSICDPLHVSPWSEPVTFHTPGDTTGVASYTQVVANVYPNPTTGIVTIQLTNNEQVMNGNIQICDIYGRLLMDSKIQTARFDLDLSSYAPGVYMLRIVNANAVLSNVKVVKE